MGGIAANAYAALWVVFAAFLLVINPAHGIADPRGLSDPDVLLPALADAPSLIVFPGLDLLLGVTLFGAAVAVGDRLGSRSRAFATPLAFGAAILLVTLATSRLATLPALAAGYAEDPGTTADLFHMVDALHTGLTVAIRFLLAAWLLLVGGSLLAGSRRVLGVGGIVAGGFNAVGLVVAPLAALNLVILPVWFAMLGWHLLRAVGVPRETASPAAD